MKSYKIFVLIFLTLLLSTLAFAPAKRYTIADKLYDKIRGTQAQKMRGYDGFTRWPRLFGHGQDEIFDIIKKETAGKFHVLAYNDKSQARGLMQIREIAIEDIPGGEIFFRWKNISEHNKIKFLDKQKIYDPYWNIYAGCAYYQLCKRRAKAMEIGRFRFTRDEIAMAYYIAGYSTWHNSIAETLSYIQ